MLLKCRSFVTLLLHLHLLQKVIIEIWQLHRLHGLVFEDVWSLSGRWFGQRHHP